MFSGAQVSLYPMTGDFIAVILGAIGALDPYRDGLRIETDDLSTLLVGRPDILFPAMRDLFVAAARSGAHCVLHATISRGCPGEPDDPICQVAQTGEGHDRPLAARQTTARQKVAEAELAGMPVAAQFSLYPLGGGHHMDEIYGCIDFVRALDIFDRPKNFCTKLRGDAGTIFAAIEQAFSQFGDPDGHLTIDLTVSANSPTAV